MPDSVAVTDTAFAAPHEIVPILSGGGTRLSCYIGILRALADLGLCYRHIVGVSGGSIVAALAAAGWDDRRMERLALATDFNQFRGFSALSLLRRGGLSSGDKFERWIDDQLEGRRFRDLPADLHVLATDINGGGPVFFSRALTPDLPVSQAVRFSMSIPLLFSFKTYEGRIMADGAILSEDALHRDWSGRGTPAVCFRLRSRPRTQTRKTRRLVPLATYLYLLVQTFMHAVSREFVRAEYWHHTIVVDTGEVSPLDFALPMDTHRLLLQLGYQTTCDHLPRKLAMSDLAAVRGTPVRPAVALPEPAEAPPGAAAFARAPSAEQA